MTDGEVDIDGTAKRTLVVVGAAAGIGRWLIDNLLAKTTWGHVALIDIETAASNLELAAKRFAGPVSLGVIQADPAQPLSFGLKSIGNVGAGSPDARVIIAVPTRAIDEVLDALMPHLDSRAAIFAVSAAQRLTLTRIRRAAGDRSLYGLHPLFDSSARGLDGQTVAIIADEVSSRSGTDQWLVDLIVRNGGLVEQLSAAEHDQTMTYVQTMAHQSLLAFAHAVTASGVDLGDVWERRTPLFEALFSLATRVLSEGQQSSIADIQVSGAGTLAARSLRASLAQITDAVSTDSPGAVEQVIESTRERFSGALFETIQATAVSTVTASQSKRAHLSEMRRLGELVGVHPISRPEALRVGRIVDMSSTSVTLNEDMAGKRGQAAILDGAGKRNAARVGVGGKPSQTVFGLGNIEILTGVELDRELDAWLAQIRRDVRFLVPESVAGAGILAIISNHPGVRRSDLLSEVVRTGQRSAVIRIWIRADYDVEEMVEELRTRVQGAYTWPLGISLPAVSIDRNHYRGPSGTFSETAARQALESTGLNEAELVAHGDFDSVLESVDEQSIALLPITSSASGVVERAVTALLRNRDPIVAGGVVDVAVRFDAYIRAGRQMADLRGAQVFSHPQALSQCTAFIKRWELKPVPCASTTEALELVASSPLDSVALAAADSPTGTRLKIAERELDDLSGSITRFLILGSRHSFSDMVGGSDPTLRSIWVAESLPDLLALLTPSASAYDELLSSDHGPCLLVTSRSASISVAKSKLRYLGRAPWSPRTPVVRVGVPPDSD